MGGRAEQLPAPRRPHPESRGDGPGLCQPGKGRADVGGRGARQGDADHVSADDLTDPAKIKEFQDAQSQLGGALGRLIAVSENYPDLKSNQNFLALQSQLEGTENRIAVARRDYIEAVRAYNTELRTFPGVLWAKTFFRGNKPMAEFTANDGAQTPPEVKF